MEGDEREGHELQQRPGQAKKDGKKKMERSKERDLKAKRQKQSR